ncbi:MAG: hypothetical protein ACLR8P_14115 [Clostridium fessum]
MDPRLQTAGYPANTFEGWLLSRMGAGGIYRAAAPTTMIRST